MRIFGDKEEDLESLKQKCAESGNLTGSFEKVSWCICLGDRQRWGEPVKEVGEAFCKFNGNTVSLFRTATDLADFTKKTAENEDYERIWKPRFQAEYDDLMLQLKDRPNFEKDQFKNKALHISTYLPHNPRFLSGLCDFRFDLAFIHAQVRQAKDEFNLGHCGQVKLLPFWTAGGREWRGYQPILRIQFGQ